VFDFFFLGQPKTPHEFKGLVKFWQAVSAESALMPVKCSKRSKTMPETVMIAALSAVIVATL